MKKTIFLILVLGIGAVIYFLVANSAMVTSAVVGSWSDGGISLLPMVIFFLFILGLSVLAILQHSGIKSNLPEYIPISNSSVSVQHGSPISLLNLTSNKSIKYNSELEKIENKIRNL